MNKKKRNVQDTYEEKSLYYWFYLMKVFC